MKLIRLYPITARIAAISASSLANAQREQMTAWNLSLQVISHLSQRKAVSAREEGCSLGRKMLDPIYTAEGIVPTEQQLAIFAKKNY